MNRLLNSLLLIVTAQLLLAPSCARTKSRMERKKDSKIEEFLTEKNQEAKITMQSKQHASSHKNAEASMMSSEPETIHKAHLSDSWYTKNPERLNAQLDTYFSLAQNQFYVEADPHAVRALIVPHAGHYFSGLCAATAYQTLFESKILSSPDIKNTEINHVIILAPNHTAYFEGAGLPNYYSYQTPLGPIAVNEQALDMLADSKHFSVQTAAHNSEHAIEIQLPFLQKTIQNFSITPLIIGNLSSTAMINDIAESLKKIIDNKTLVIVSTDFMHYGNSYNYTPFSNNICDQMRQIDSQAVQAIINKSQSSFEKVLTATQTNICGQNPLRIFLNLVEHNLYPNLSSRLTCYHSSAQMIAARKNSPEIKVSPLLNNVSDSELSNAVSYVGMIFTQQDIKKLSKEHQLTDYEKKALVTVARNTISNEFLGNQKKSDLYLSPMISQGVEQATGAFVTLNTNNQQLRGCIGKIFSSDPLYKTVIEMARAAAFKDHRFPPLKPQELAEITIDVSVLTTPEKIASFEEIQLGKHGIILNNFDKDGIMKATALFLPCVAPNNHWSLRTMLEQLSIKAGIGKDGWTNNTEFQVFEAIEIHDPMKP